MADYPYRISYGSVLSQVEAYYGQGSPVWDAIVADSSTGFSSANYGYLEQIGINPILAQDGSVLGYYQTAPMPSHGNTTYEVVNSNKQSATYSGNSTTAKVSGTATQTEVAGKTQTTFNSGAKSVSTGQRVATVGMNVLSTISVVGLASRLGKAVDDAFYDSGASWAFSDEDWNDLYWRSDGLGKFFLNTLYGVNGDNGTMYTDEQALAQTYMLLRSMGVYDTSPGVTHNTTNVPIAGGAGISNFNQLLTDATATTYPASVPFNYITTSRFVSTGNDGRYTVITGTRPFMIFNVRPNSGVGFHTISFDGSYTLTTDSYSANGVRISDSSGTTTASHSTVSVDGVTIDFWYARSKINQLVKTY